MDAKDNSISYNPDAQQLTCQGDWELSKISALEALLSQTKLPTEGQLSIDGKAIDKLDTAGTWLLLSLQKRLEKQGVKSELVDFSEQHQALLTAVSSTLAEEKPFPKTAKLDWIATLGKDTIMGLQEFQRYLSFVGSLSVEALRIAGNPKHYRFSALASVIYRNGFQALPIIALLSFMIGVVITYQMGLQLRNYGANIFIVDLLGLSILREFGPLLTAIMIAGRTGSAYTAQLGMMKLNQEIDALDTLGVTPAELLLLPRILGLVIALPLITIWSDIFGVLGGMVTAHNMLDITWYDFLHRFPRVIPLKALLIGLGKTPVFALIISSVGCFEGMRVKDTADSVGQNTTKSVVLSIFFIIVADAIFSVIFSELKL